MDNVYQNMLKKRNFDFPHDWLLINTIDMHVGGEPLRVILDGFPEPEGISVLGRRRYCKEHYDHLRRMLLFEPRGHADMYGCVLVPPNDDEGDFGILFLHNMGYSTMCGHAIIALSTLAVQMGWVEAKEGGNLIKIDAPCGRIRSFAQLKNGRVTGVRFHGVPSFVVGLDRTVEVEGLGRVTYDLAYGGAFYAYVDMSKHNFGFDLSPASYQQLITNGMAIKRAVMAADSEIIHPMESDLSFLYGTIFIGDSTAPGIDSRNVCIFANGEVDRCPTGSGVSGRLAIHRAKNEIDLNKNMSVESITGSVFKGAVISDLKYGPYNAVIPQVAGTAYITGKHTFCIDPNDPIKNGFILR